MEEVKLNRLMKALLPFIVMVLIERIFILFLGKTPLPRIFVDLLSFLPAAFSAIIFFHVSNFAGTDDDSTRGKEKRPIFDCVTHSVMVAAILIVLMYVLSSILNGSQKPIRLSFITLVSSVVIHPFLEEYIFRYLFYTQLRQMSTIFGGIAQAIMFAIVHDSIEGMLFALCGGFAFAVLFEKLGRLFPAVIVHAALNLRSLLYLTVFASTPTVRGVADIVILTLGFASFLFLFIRHGHSKAAERKTKCALSPTIEAPEFTSEDEEKDD